MAESGGAPGAAAAARYVVESFGLAGRVAIVAGGTGGIGALVARRMADAGARVLVQHRGSATEAESLVAGIRRAGGVAEQFQGDLATPADADRMFEACKERHGPADVLVNCAGSYRSKPLTELDVQDWRAGIEDNLGSAFACIRAAAAHMAPLGRGSIVNIGSIAAHSPAAHQASYNSAKAAVLALTRSAAQELGPFGIRVNSVSPGLIHCRNIEIEWPDGVSRWMAKAPLQRLGTPDDVAAACIFLSSPAASWITGQDLVVDGGMLASPIY